MAVHSSFGWTLETQNIHLVNSIIGEFNRLVGFSKIRLGLDVSIKNNVLWVEFTGRGMTKYVRVPLPSITEVGVEIIDNNDVVRGTCTYWLEREQLRVTYHDVIRIVFCDEINAVMPQYRSGSSMINKVIKSFSMGTTEYMVNQLQRMINDIVNVLPLHETDVHTWCINHRIMILDPDFDEIRDPNKQLKYQVDKNLKYYPQFGWSSIGLSDGVLADKNYILDADLRKLTPFGLHHHPKRNLFSTLSMTGDELPRIRSKSMQQMIERGLSRTGWNLTTVVLDLPLNFEDQILVSSRLKNLFGTIHKKFMVYGNRLTVRVGDTVEMGDVIGFASDGEPVVMDTKCESGRIVATKRDLVELSGEQVEVWSVEIECVRFLKDGFKFTNMHGNKGIIKAADLGYAVNPKTGEETPIDVIISGVSINKRCNFGQLVEILSNNLMPEGKDHMVVSDDYTTDKATMSKALKNAGFPDDGTWAVYTPWGDFATITGTMFWGLIKYPEDRMWSEKQTRITDNKATRHSGLKLSFVEIGALFTQFGPGNPVVKEIMGYSQNIIGLKDELRIIDGAHNEFYSEFPVVDIMNASFVPSVSGMFHKKSDIKGTVVDENFYPDGFVLRLPMEWQALVSKEDRNDWSIGMVSDVINADEYDVYKCDRVFIPNAFLRRCWRHPSGKWGLSELGSCINVLVERCHIYMDTESLDDKLKLLRGIYTYFSKVSGLLCTKTGDLSTYGMSIRHPFSAMATAALADNLPENTIQIHRDMATTLKVKTGDPVLVERFPCLGYMSVRPQWVNVTDDPECKYIIRVSGNSLVSMNLDFDGDTLFIAAVHTPAAIECLQKALWDTSSRWYKEIQRLNGKKTPATKESSLDDFDITYFPKPTNEQHAELVKKLTGVKSHTGPVIALCYNLRRIVERVVPASNTDRFIDVENVLDFLGNNVFSQKHGIDSIQDEVTDALCCGDIEGMVELGIDRKASTFLCDLIRAEAAKIGVFDLVQYHQKAKRFGWSKIINKIVRMKHHIYFASRSLLGPYELRRRLQCKPVDLPSHMMTSVLSTPVERVSMQLADMQLDRTKRRVKFKLSSIAEASDILCSAVDGILG